MSGGNWKELFAACRDGDIALASYHISSGADVNYQHPEVLSTPLLEAIRNGHLEVVRYLLENGADPRIREAFGTMDALKQAKRMKNREMVKMIKSYLG